MATQFAFDNSYARLPDRFFARLPPTPVAAPRLVKVNRDLATQLGLDPDWLAGPDGVARLQELVETSGAAAEVEATIDAAHAESLAALETAEVTDEGRTALRALADAAVRRTF